ncbi:MAG: 16S rRNA (cytosine(1402)-N(4))-methyltransferase, partial [Acidaminococcaceae bacterium]|nr:16S rRNA (cytosine(1402)-N(4))-methyltransferase [Acidaminococcaceae bacterium]
MEFSHVSVLLTQCVDWLMTDPDGTYVDCTLGGAGHSAEIATRLSAKGRLVGIDQDTDALAAAADRLKGATCRVDIVRSNFKD